MKNQKLIKIPYLEKCLIFFYNLIIIIGIAVSFFIIYLLLFSIQDQIELKNGQESLSLFSILLIISIILLISVITYIFYKEQMLAKWKLSEEIEENEHKKVALQQAISSLEMQRILLEILKRGVNNKEDISFNNNGPITFIDYVFQEHHHLVDKITDQGRMSDIEVLKEKINEEIIKEPILFKKFTMNLQELVLKNKKPIEKKPNKMKAILNGAMTAILILIATSFFFYTVPFLFNFSFNIFNWAMLMPSVLFGMMLTLGYGFCNYRHEDRILKKSFLEENNVLLENKKENLFKKLFEESEKNIIDLIKRNKDFKKETEKENQKKIQPKEELEKPLKVSSSIFKSPQENDNKENPTYYPKKI